MLHTPARSTSIAIPTFLAICLSATIGAAQEEPTSSLAQALDVEVEPGSVVLFPCELGESLSIPGSGVRRVSVDDASILKVRADKDGSKLRFECSQEGTTLVTVDRKDGRRLLAVRVAAAVRPPGDLDASSCGDLAGVEARVIVEARSVQAVSLYGASDDQAVCLRNVIGQSNWTNRSSMIARLSW